PRSELTAAWAERDAGDGALMTFEHPLWFGGFDVPQTNRAIIARGGDQFGIRTHRDAHRRRIMREDDMAPPGRQIPKSDGVIAARRNEEPSVGREGHLCDCIGMLSMH